MISLEKWTILTPLQKFPNNVGDLGKIIFATSFEWLPKVQKIAHSGHTAHYLLTTYLAWQWNKVFGSGRGKKFEIARVIFNGVLVIKHDWFTSLKCRLKRHFEGSITSIK